MLKLQNKSPQPPNSVKPQACFCQQIIKTQMPPQSRWAMDNTPSCSHDPTTKYAFPSWPKTSLQNLSFNTAFRHPMYNYPSHSAHPLCRRRASVTWSPTHLVCKSNTLPEWWPIWWILAKSSVPLHGSRIEGLDFNTNALGIVLGQGVYCILASKGSFS